MPGSSSWMPYAAQGVKGFDDDDGDDDDDGGGDGGGGDDDDDDDVRDAGTSQSTVNM